MSNLVYIHNRLEGDFPELSTAARCDIAHEILKYLTDTIDENIILSHDAAPFEEIVHNVYLGYTENTEKEDEPMEVVIDVDPNTTSEIHEHERTGRWYRLDVAYNGKFDTDRDFAHIAAFLREHRE